MEELAEAFSLDLPASLGAGSSVRRILKTRLLGAPWPLVIEGCLGLAIALGLGLGWGRNSPRRGVGRRGAGRRGAREGRGTRRCGERSRGGARRGPGGRGARGARGGLSRGGAGWRLDEGARGARGRLDLGARGCGVCGLAAHHCEGQRERTKEGARMEANSSLPPALVSDHCRE